MAKKFKFRILQGSHTEGKGENTREYSARDRGGKLKEGFSDIIETDKPLDSMFGSDKFRKMHGETEQLEENLPQKLETKEEGLASFSLVELREYATEEEIDLQGCTKKAEVLQLIQEHLG